MKNQNPVSTFIITFIGVFAGSMISSTYFSDGDYWLRFAVSVVSSVVIITILYLLKYSVSKLVARSKERN